MRQAFIIIALVVMACILGASKTDAPAPLATLSAYGFFEGKLSELKPAMHLIPYEVIAPLFSDYAEKQRLIALPPDGKMQIKGTEILFPEHTTIIKTFFYTRPDSQSEVKETRLLIKTTASWKALTYVWRADQTDADLEIAGTTIPSIYTDQHGQKTHFDYTVPNVNQCKGCHSYDGKFTLLGLIPSQVNHHLADWREKGWLIGELKPMPQAMHDYSQTSTASLDAKARSYLHANCGHCHHAHGPASTSGLFLDIAETDLNRLGLNKPPVASGRGSGKRKYGIVAGHPEQSILSYRMESKDPGIRMPELGRELIDKEGVALINQWIKSLQK
jgi:uncharacterized repeat protein (TIGR03806 family)